MKQYKSYQTERLILRPVYQEDADFILELLNCPKWLQNIGDRNVKSLEDAKNYIATRMMPQLERLGYGNFAVIRKSDGARMGCCGLYDREGLEGVDIGFSFLPEYERKGYAYESAEKMMQLARDEFKLTRVSGITIEANTGSRKLLEKLGLKFEKFVTLPNDDEELMYYAIQFS
jgi:ribosomal-protein-alanine N-acetyltransferase